MLKTLLCAAAAMVPVAAAAQSLSGPYVAGDVGAGFASDMTSSGSTARIDRDVGPTGSLAAGWRFTNGFRAELDGGYEANGVGSINTPSNATGALAPVRDGGGTASAYSVTANLLYDLPLQGWIKPYVGLGVGYGWLNLSDLHGIGYGTLRLPEDNRFTSFHTVQFGTGGALAYQARVGLSAPIRRIPGLSLTAEYRFMGTARADVPVTRVAITTDRVNGVIPSGSGRYGFVAGDNLLTLGFRYAFGAR